MNHTELRPKTKLAKTPIPPVIEWLSTLDQRGIHASAVQSDSRKIQAGDIFMAWPGQSVDGRDYIAQALQNGAAAVLWDPSGDFSWPQDHAVVHLAVAQLREHAGLIASHINGYPSQQMKVIGVTGTNGKTSIAYWLTQALVYLGQKTALIGTISSGLYGRLSDSTTTTPDASELQAQLAQYRQAGAQAVVMEVSSHGLDQGRVNGNHFHSAVLSNLTRDHLDYHRTMSAYAQAKEKLFHWPELKHAIINNDDAFGRQLLRRIDQSKTQIIRYGLQQTEVYASQLNTSETGIDMMIKSPWGSAKLHANVLGRFNASNLLACLATLCAQGFALNDAIAALETVTPARGRMQCLGGENTPLIVVDYAHTPDSLYKVLQTLDQLRPASRKLFCVFGCGGERDKGKRSLMGAIADTYADTVVVTNDNPRHEDPLGIIKQICSGMRRQAQIEPQRARAIFWAVGRACANDIVLIAGKGHETHQDIDGVQQPFSDLCIAQEALNQWKKANHAELS